MHRSFRHVAVLAAVTAIAGLCAVGAPAAQAQATNPFNNPTKFCTKTAPPPGTRNSSSPGITPNTITLVEGSADVSNIVRQGIVPPPNVPSTTAFVNEINDVCGGINGRKIIIKRLPYNSSATDVVAHQTANCLKATEEYKAFIIFNSTTPGVFPRCTTVQHKSILMTGNAGLFNFDDQVASKGRLMSRYPSADMAAKGFVTYALKHGFFKNKKVMVLGVNRDLSSAADMTAQYVAPLKAAGIDAYLEALPCISGNSCRSQVGAVVARAKSNGVDTILSTQSWVPSTFGVLFKNMQEQNLHAKIVGPMALSIHHDSLMPSTLGDAGVAGMKWANDEGVFAYSMDDHTSLGAWRNGTKPTAFGQMCLDTLNRQLKNNPPWTYARKFQENGYFGLSTQICKEMRAIARALWTLGNNVTTERFVTAISQELNDRVETVPAFDKYTFYTVAHPTPTKIAPYRMVYPCPDVTPAIGCTLPAEFPVRALPIS